MLLPLIEPDFRMQWRLFTVYFIIYTGTFILFLLFCVYCFNFCLMSNVYINAVRILLTFHFLLPHVLIDLYLCITLLKCYTNKLPLPKLENRRIGQRTVIKMMSITFFYCLVPLTDYTLKPPTKSADKNNSVLIIKCSLL